LITSLEDEKIKNEPQFTGFGRIYGGFFNEWLLAAAEYGIPGLPDPGK